MPDLADYRNEDDWMADCVPARIEEGDDQDRAVAACLSIWREKSMSKAEREMAAWLEEWSEWAIRTR